MLLGTKRFSNIEQQKIHREAQNNSTNFFKHFNVLQEYSDKKKAITNIKDMNQQYKNLLTNGTINENDWEAETLNELIKEASTFLTVAQPSLDDILNHYSTYQNFNDVISDFVKEVE